MEPTKPGPRSQPLPRLPEEGTLVKGKYRLRRLLGDGGMGSVYEARHEGLGVRVALKFLHPRLSRWPGLVQRFLDEARLAAPIRSPHVVQVLDVDQSEDGLAFIVLELLSGPTLRQLLEARRLGEEEARAFAAQLCDGLDAVHAAGIVHRDLKPENVMVTEGPLGEPLIKLLDFGIAMPDGAGDPRSSRPGAVLGTPGYMAPEQEAAPFAVDARADLYSLGVLLFEMLTGRLPGAGERLEDAAPAAAPELAAVIARATSPCPADRFATAEEMRGAIAMGSFGEVALTPAQGRVRASLSGAPSARASRTSVEAPWFCPEVTPPPPPTPAPRSVPEAPSAPLLSVPEAPAPAAPARERRWVLPAVALALAVGVVLGGSASRLLPGLPGPGGRGSYGLLAAMEAAPRTAVQADPAPSAPVSPEATLAAALPVAVTDRPADRPKAAPASAKPSPPPRSTASPAPAPPPPPPAPPSLPPPPAPRAEGPVAELPPAPSPDPVREAPTAPPPAAKPPPPPPSEEPVAEAEPTPDPWPGARERRPGSRRRVPRRAPPHERVIRLPLPFGRVIIIH